MRVLVTGATGFTGGHLAAHLLARGHDVRALVRDAARAEGLARQGIDLAVGDLRDRASLGAALRGVEVVYHVAAVYREAGLGADDYQAVNAQAPAAIVEASGFIWETSGQTVAAAPTTAAAPVATKRKSRRVG